MKHYILQGKERYAASAVTIFTHYPEDNEEQLPNVYLNEELKWFSAECDDDDNIAEILADTDLTGEIEQELEGWQLTEWDSNYGDWDIPYDLSETQQEEIDEKGYYEFLGELGYDTDEMVVTTKKALRLLEVVPNKTQGVTHTYDYHNKRRYKPFSDEQLTMELLRGDFTPNAIHYRITETLQPYGIKLNKRHATEYKISRKNKANRNKVDIDIELSDNGHYWMRIRKQELVSKDEKSYVSEQDSWRATNHTTLSECMRKIQEALELVK